MTVVDEVALARTLQGPDVGTETKYVYGNIMNTDHCTQFIVNEKSERN